jgi:hypothetical protein
MDPFSTHIIATSRYEEFAREAATERIAKSTRRDRKRNAQAEPRPAPRHSEAPRPVTA